jgi:hypothetical protein
MEISEQEYKELKSHSQMLGIIGTYVEDFSKEDDTVLQAVLRLLADYYAMRSEEIYSRIEKI